MFSLVSGLPSTPSAGGPSPLFGCFAGTMPLYDSPSPYTWGLIAHRFLPPARGLPTTDGDGASRFSRVEFLCMRGVFDSAGTAVHSRYRAPPYCLPGWRDTVGSPDLPFSELNTQPAYTPVQRFKCSLTAALAWLGARMVRYSFPV